MTKDPINIALPDQYAFPPVQKINNFFLKKNNALTFYAYLQRMHAFMHSSKNQCENKTCLPFSLLFVFINQVT